MREFWIETKSFSSQIMVAYYEKPDELTYRIAKDVTHVIEYSAYEAAKITGEQLAAKVTSQQRDIMLLEQQIESLKRNVTTLENLLSYHENRE